MKVIILGGKGFVGSAFERQLIKRGAECFVVTRDSYKDSIGSHCDLLINTSTNSKKPLASLHPEIDFVETVINIKNSLLNFNYQKYILISSADVYVNTADPLFNKEDEQINVASQSEYGFHKYLGELMVQNYAKNWLIFRMGGFVGTGLKKNAIYDIKSGGKLWINPNSELQFMDTDTAAEIILDVNNLGLKNEIYNLCGEGCINLQSVIAMVGKKVEPVDDAKYIKYEISLEKIKRLTMIPSTEKMVFNYLKNNI